MKQIYVDASSSYIVHIGHQLLSQTASYISEISDARKAAIISDTNVFPLWGDIVVESLKSAGYQVYSFVFIAGENSKNGNTYLEIVNFLAENNLTKSDILIALGGGVVGDITGFAAATYLRGIAYIQIPTTLLSMVDSSVGGKTAIDLPAGKNLVGAFSQPKLVLCSLDTLSTLPQNIFIDGCAEVIKYSILYDAELFQHLWNHGLNFDREYVIEQCISWKRNVVKEDEFDCGARQKLNLGHTIGHAVEALSDYTISHGRAVSIGIATITKAAVQNNNCSIIDYNRIVDILKKFNLPTKMDYTSQQLCTIAAKDKKRANDYLNLIIPETIGQCNIYKIPMDQLQSFIEAGL